MTQNLFATQQDVLAYAQANLAAPGYDTDYPAVGDEPTDNGMLIPYWVMRSNDALRIATGGAVGGARHDEMYTLFDFLAVGPTAEGARVLAYGPGGIADVMTGYVPIDAGQMNRAGGGQVFVAVDGTGARPSNFIARVSFRLAVNMEITE